MKRIYPWLIAVLGLLVLLVSNGLIFTGITAFDESLLTEFGWSRGALKFRDLLTLLLTGLLAPLMGALIDRAGPRLLAMAGSLLLAALYLAYSRVGAIGHVYLIHIGFAVVLSAAGLNVAVIMVSQWFVARRGTAIGIALIGTSLGGVVFPKLIVSMLPALGWRQSFLWLSAIPVGLFVLLSLLARSPQSLGLQPFGAGAVKSDPGASHTAPDIGYAAALRTRTFWSLALVAMTTYYCMMSVTAHLFLHMRDMQFELAAAGQALAVMFALGLVGKFTFGVLADLFRPHAVLLINLVVMAAGTFLLATLRPGLIWYALILFGLGWGGIYTMIQLLAVSAFGLSAAGKILGTITLLDAGAAGLGVWATALLFDRFGSYQIAFNVLCVLMVLALIGATQVRSERTPTRTMNSVPAT